MSNNNYCKSLTKRAGCAVLWQILGTGWRTIVRLGASIILARVLTPYAFGVFTTAIIVYGMLSHVGASGMSSGIIVKDNITEDDLNTCFWSIAFIRLVLFIFVFLSASFIAYLFKDHKLIPIIRLIAICYLIESIGVIPNVILTKELNFKLLNIIGCISTFLGSLTAVFLAVVVKLSYWSLVVAMLVNSLIYNLSILLVTKWYPRFTFSKESFSYLFHFGIYSLGNSIISYFNQNMDYILVGRFLGLEELGIYEFAYKLPHLFLDIVARMIGSIAFPSFAEIKNNNKLLLEGYIKVLKIVSIISFPILLILSAVSGVLVPVLWGHQWIAAVLPLRILCIAAIFSCIVQSSGSILYCKNRPDLSFKFSLLTLFWMIICVVVLGYYYGIKGVAIAVTLSYIPRFIVMNIVAKMLDVNLLAIFRELFYILFSSIIAGLISYILVIYLQSLNMLPVVILIIAIILGSLSYFILMIFYPSSGLCDILDILISVSNDSSFLNKFLKKINNYI